MRFATDISSRESDLRAQTLGRLVGGIAHDVNNLLTAILGNAELALAGLALESPVRRNILEIETASQYAADLCRQLLRSSKSGLAIETLHVSEVVEEIGRVLQGSFSKNAVLEFQLADDVPLIAGRAPQIRRIAMNLILNAAEAMREKNGTIRVRTGKMECDPSQLKSCFGKDPAEGLYVYLEVSDTGSGMNQETKKRIFDPLFTTKASAWTEFGISRPL